MLPSEWEKRLVDLNVTNLTQEDLAAASVRTIGGSCEPCSDGPGCAPWRSTSFHFRQVAALHVG
jgi:anti-sigma factor RsiW